MELIKPDRKYLDSYLEAVEDDKINTPNSSENFSYNEDFFDIVQKREQGIDLPEGYVPNITLWLVNKEKFIGSSSIKFPVTRKVAKFPAHIGYGIAFKERGKGYGNLLLKMVLDYLRNNYKFIRNVSVDCDIDNEKSEKIIVKNGGVFSSIILVNDTRKIKRFWIDLYPVMLESERLFFVHTDRKYFEKLKETLYSKESLKYNHRPENKDYYTNLWIEWCKASYLNEGFELFTLISKENGEYVGTCGCSIQNIDGSEVAEIGYHLHPSFFKKGYASEAAKTIKDHIFSNYLFDSLYSYMNTNNINSKNVAIKNGMSFVKDYYDTRFNEELSVYKIDRSVWIKGK